MSANDRGCVKTLEVVATTQQRNRRPRLIKISDARETWGLNQSCAQLTGRKVFTQPRPETDMLAAFPNAIYSPKVDKSAPARHGIRLHDRLQSLPARTEFFGKDSEMIDRE
jgi:hypothetical protein